jgi:hypothetical protein
VSLADGNEKHKPNSKSGDRKIKITALAETVSHHQKIGDEMRVGFCCFERPKKNISQKSTEQNKKKTQTSRQDQKKL